jgi:fructose-1,6-bisphosphatase/inositol monophosphatase family enzyme
VDKKRLLNGLLAKIMVDQVAQINLVVQSFPEAKVQIKSDGTPVTELDLELSALVEALMLEHFPHVTFYSEEKFSEWSFPLLALDPLDGTREYIDGRDEWAISIGVFPTSHFSGDGWVYNPKTNECFWQGSSLPFTPKETYQGEVSRSEWKSGYFKNANLSKFEIHPMGSIAYKLGRLSAGKSDFVVSLRPKSIWDIAGGSLLCQQVGIKFYSQGKEVTQVEKEYPPPLIWCRPELFLELSKIYS